MLKRIVVDGRYKIDRTAIRAANWFGLTEGGLSDGQQRRLRQRRSWRKVARQMLMRQAEGTLWFTDGSMPAIPRQPAGHRLLLLNIGSPLSPEAVAKWIQGHGIETLQVTGIEGEDNFVFTFLCKVFLALSLSFRNGRNLTLEPGSILLMDHANAQAISPWPKLQVYQKAFRWRLSTNEGFARAMHSLRIHAAVSHVKQFLERIPDGARTFLQYPDSHRRFIRLFQKFEPQISDLMLGNAWMLVYMLCHRDAFPGAAQMDRHDLSQKQRVIWAKFGMPASESVARLMRKITPAGCSLELFHAMRQVFASEAAIAHVRQLSRIGLGTARVAVHQLATAALVREVGGNDIEITGDQHGQTPAARLLHDIVEEAKDRGANNLLRPIQTVAAAHRLMQAILRLPSLRQPGLPQEHIRRNSTAYQATIQLNTPSVPGLIEQLSDAGMLSSEGRLMGHCVASYWGRVSSRTSLVFRVLQGKLPGIDRSTLELVPGVYPRLWGLGQLKGVRNQGVSDETRMVVVAWLEQVNENPQIGAEELEEACLAAIGPPARMIA